MFAQWRRIAMTKILSSFDDYLRLERGRSDDTRKRYNHVAAKLLVFLSEHGSDETARLRNATEDDIRAFLVNAAATRSGERSAFMWNQKLAAVRTLYRFLVKRQLVHDNPAGAIEVVDAIAEEKIPLTIPEFIALVRAIESRDEPYRSRDLALVHVAFHCALRVGELNRLDLTHLDTQGGYIVNLRAKRKKYLLLPLPPLAAQALQLCIATRRAFRPKPDVSAVFLSERGTRLSVRHIEGLISNYAREAGITRRISPHFLRHSIATVHALLGTRPWDIQRLLNHDSLATTERYIHTLQSLRTAMWSIDALLARMLIGNTETQSQVPGEGALHRLGSPSLPVGPAPFP